jgi:hypothetical protein
MKPQQTWWTGALVCGAFLLFSSAHLQGQARPPTVRIAYSALSAGIGALWLTHEQGIFKKARP